MIKKITGGVLETKKEEKGVGGQRRLYGRGSAREKIELACFNFKIEN